MFKNCKKEDLRQIASELGEEISDKMTIVQLIELIKSNQYYKEDLTFVTELINSTVEDRKNSEKREFDLEQIKLERAKAEIELAKIRAESKVDNKSEKEVELCDSLDSLIKSVRTLTIKVPSNPEGWGYFFSSLERAFASKSVPEKYKAEILLNLMSEKASNIITYIKDDELNNYEKVKEIILREFEPTPQSCLEHFRKATRQVNETYTQFASRLVTSWEYYLKLRKVSDFKELNELIVSDKLFSSLEKEVASHIAVRQGEKWFKPVELGKEVDLYYTSSGKTLKHCPGTYKKSPNERNVSKVFLCEVKKCGLCNDKHPLYKCPNYKKLSVNERIEYVKANNFCFNCLGGHRVSNCKSKYSCNLCKRRHHVTLHFSSEQKQITNEKRETNASEGDRILSPPLSASAAEFKPSVNNQFNRDYFVATNTSLTNSKTVLLSTFICLLSDDLGNTFPVRALMDTGAMANFLSLRCVDKLNLRKRKINIAVSGLNGLSFTIKSKVNATITNKRKDFKLNLEFLVVQRITDLTPSRKLDINFPELNNISLADTGFKVPGPIDLLLGAENFYEILKPGQIYPSGTNLILQNTAFGFVVSGSVPTPVENNIHCGIVNDCKDLEEIIQSFWELENCEGEKIKNKEELFCDEHFIKTHTRDRNGKYIVKMPLKENPANLGESKQVARKRLDSLWARLRREPEILSLYKDFINEYLNLNHMEEVKESQEPDIVYYLPHHGVVRRESNSTPLRVVFNASALTSKGNSLNSIQYKGGVIQDDVFGIMLRFRKHLFAFVSDVRKMFRMIWINPDQRDLLRILWKSSECEPIKTYRLRTVTYGTTSAPYLATRTLQQLAYDEGEQFPMAASVLLSDVYMDDLLTGADQLVQAQTLQEQLIALLDRSGMTLHKWAANHPSLLKNQVNGSTEYSFNMDTKTLGIAWNPQYDYFFFSFKPDLRDKYTKRQVLSQIAKTFDPLGLLGPFVTKSKIFMQKLWLLKIDWNEPLPEVENREWYKFNESFREVPGINIPRFILVPNPIEIELHGFSDSSEAAYGAVIYCKTTSAENSVSVRLLCSKSRVCPLKKTTIPRLELCAAVLLAKLMHRVISSLKLEYSAIHFWSDSNIVLSWIKKEPHLLKTFVANRIAKIQSLTKTEQWHYIPSDKNPADLLSRGMDAKTLQLRKLWWDGPEFLIEGEYPKGDVDEAVIYTETGELKNCNQIQNCMNVTINNFINDLMTCCNKYFKLICVISYCLRFCSNCRKVPRRAGPLETSEIKIAEERLVKLVQGEYFKGEINSLKNSGILQRDSSIRNLNPFIDNLGILRVGGRLKNSDLTYEKKFPIILPSKHKLTELIVNYYHLKYLHAGPQSLLYHLRQKFWIVNGRKLCRKIVHNCVICFKVKPVTLNQIMGDLPKERVTKNFPFNVSGIDFCGPFYIKYKNQRKGIFQKIYVSIFICFATKAIHLECVTDLTTASFIETLKKFISRRGKPAKLFTDNAKNFVGASKEIKKLHNLVCKPDDVLAGYLASEEIDWSFLPPRAPNFGGLWEAGVKSFKYYLKRVVGNLKLTFEEFNSIVIQIEGMLNSRPLLPLTSEMEAIEVLTPAHFLIGRPLYALIEPDLTNINENRLKSWQKLTRIFQFIWKKWSSDYLNNLQERHKWIFYKNNVKIGDVVLVKEDNLPPLKWSLGKIVDVYPGKDNKIRVAEIKTASGQYKRPISKLCLLPVNE